MIASEYPAISVVIPLYNGGKFIEAALDSVLQQPVSVAEIIIVDDGSTDNGPELARKHPSKPMVVTQENKGPSATRNRGIRLSKSPFVAFIDQDDLWRPNKLALQCEAFAQDPELVVCFGRIDYFWEDPDCDEARTFKGHHRTTAVQGYVTTTMLAHRSVFTTVGFFDETLMHADSIQWCADLLASKTKTCMLDEVILDHRMHDNNLTRRREKGTSEILGMLRQRRLAAKSAAKE